MALQTPLYLDTNGIIRKLGGSDQLNYGNQFVQVAGGRLTGSTGNPVLASGVVTGATTIYYSPFRGDWIALWDGTEWALTNFTETSLALGTMTSGANYDIFGFLSSGALAIEKLIWSGDTSRATNITFFNGVLCKSGDQTRRYLGTIRSTSTTGTEDSDANRFIWNYNNRVLRPFSIVNSTAHQYNTNTWRPWNNDGTNALRWVQGWLEDALQFNIVANINGPTSSANQNQVGLIHRAATGTPQYIFPSNCITGAGGIQGGGSALLDDSLATVGYRFLTVMEIGATTSGNNFLSIQASAGVWG